MHFFDAAHLLAGTLPEAVQAMSAAREDGTVDLVSATTRHPGGLLAGFTHGFSHADRCERQLMRLDHGTAEVRVDGLDPGPSRARRDGPTTPGPTSRTRCPNGPPSSSRSTATDSAPTPPSPST